MKDRRKEVDALTLRGAQEAADDSAHSAVQIDTSWSASIGSDESNPSTLEVFPPSNGTIRDATNGVSTILDLT